MELIRYLNDAYFTEQQLLDACGIDASELAALQERGVMPQPSYHLKLDIACDSFFGPRSEQASVSYYGKGNLAWIGVVQSVATAADAFAIFAQRYKYRLAALAAAGVTTSAEKLGAGLDAHIETEWKYFLDGTYGLCTKSGLPEDIAAKELAVFVIKEITGERADTVLDDAMRARLTIAVDLLDTASSMFAPHERARSSRHRLIDEVRRNYRL